MSVELSSVHPTRLELLRLKRRKAMAEGIVDILKKELDLLTLTLFEFVKKVSPLRDQMHATLREAYDLFIETEMLCGSKRIEEISLVVKSVEYKISEETKKSILGLFFPIFQLFENSHMSRLRFNPLDTPANLNESISNIKEALYDVVKLAEIQESIKILVEVISTKKRQINRIQFKILPELDATIRYIELILEETERQDAIRVRVLQRKRKERALKNYK